MLICSFFPREKVASIKSLFWNSGNLCPKIQKKIFILVGIFVDDGFYPLLINSANFPQKNQKYLYNFGIAICQPYRTICLGSLAPI